MRKFFRKDDGLVTIEWVGMAAVMVIAAIAIAAFVMQGADATANAIDAKQTAVQGDIANSTADPDLDGFGDGL